MMRNMKQRGEEREEIERLHWNNDVALFTKLVEGCKDGDSETSLAMSLRRELRS